MREKLIPIFCGILAIFFIIIFTVNFNPTTNTTIHEETILVDSDALKACKVFTTYDYESSDGSRMRPTSKKLIILVPVELPYDELYLRVVEKIVSEIEVYFNNMKLSIDCNYEMVVLK